MWISNCIKYKVWDEITYRFPNFNGVAVEFRIWIRNFFPHFTEHVISFPCEGQGQSMLIKKHVMHCWGMVTSPNGNIFRVTGPLWGEFTGHRWIPLTKASDAELWCFLRSVPEQTVEQTIETHRAHYDVPLMVLCGFTIGSLTQRPLQMTSLVWNKHSQEAPTY